MTELLNASWPVVPVPPTRRNTGRCIKELFFWAIEMNEIAVIGPVDGLYHLGYHASAQKFYSINEFVSKELAEITAWRMNQDRMKGWQ